jgi:hypothetical protein
MDPETTRTVVTVTGGIMSALGGVGVGYALSLRSTRNEQDFQRGEAEKERGFRESQRVRELQENAARDLNRALNQAGNLIPTQVRRRYDVAADLAAGHQQVRIAWGDVEALLRHEPSITSRLTAFELLLFIAEQDCTTDGHVEQNFYPLALGFNNLQNAISAFVTRNDPPAPSLPLDQLNELAYPAGENLGLEGVRRYAAENYL